MEKLIQMQISLLEALSLVTKEKEELANALAATKLQLSVVTEERDSLKRQLLLQRNLSAEVTGVVDSCATARSSLQDECNMLQTLAASIVARVERGDGGAFQKSHCMEITSVEFTRPQVEVIAQAKIPDKTPAPAASNSNFEKIWIIQAQALDADECTRRRGVDGEWLAGAEEIAQAMRLAAAEAAGSLRSLEVSAEPTTASTIPADTDDGSRDHKGGHVVIEESTAASITGINASGDLSSATSNAVVEDVAAEDEMDLAEKAVLESIHDKLRNQEAQYQALLADRIATARRARDQAIKAAAQRILNSEEAAGWLSGDSVPLSEVTPEQMARRREVDDILRQAREIQLREEAERQQAEDKSDEAKSAAAAARVKELEAHQEAIGKSCAALLKECLECSAEYDRRRNEVALAREARETAAAAQDARDARYNSSGSQATSTGVPPPDEQPSDPNLRAMMKLLLPRHKVKVDRRRGQLTVDEERRKRQEAEENDSADMERLAARENENEKRLVEAVERWEEASRIAISEAERAARDDLFRRYHRCISRQHQREQNSEGQSLLSTSTCSKRSVDSQHLRGLLKLLRSKQKKGLDIDKRKSSLETDEEARLKEEEQQAAIQLEHVRETSERERAMEEEECLTKMEELARLALREQSRMIRFSAFRYLMRLVAHDTAKSVENNGDYLGNVVSDEAGEHELKVAEECSGATE